MSAPDDGAPTGAVTTGPLPELELSSNAVAPSRTLLALVVLAAPLLVLTSPRYVGSSDLHSATEVVGAAIGLVAALTLIQRFLALGDQAHLLFGVAFFTSASVDVVHGLIPFLATRGYLTLASATVERIVPATYLAGRIVAGLVLLAAPLLASRDLGRARRGHAWRIVALSIAGGAALTVVLAIAPLPQLVFSDRIVGRPADLVPSVVLAAATALLLRWHHRTADPMTWWVAIATAAAAIGALSMSLSNALHDIFFDTAHGYKVLSYLLPLVGLSLYQVRLIAQREALADDLHRHARELTTANVELAEANAVKSEFVSVVSHELRTPLSAILGFASAMLDFWDDTPDAEKREHVTIIQRQGDRLRRLIDDLLVRSRLDAGALVAQPADLDAAAVADRVVHDLGDGAAGIHVDVPEGTIVHADEDHLEQILLNYLTNAHKYGEPPIRVTTEPSEPGWVTLAVTDDGPGVDPEFRDQLFETFAQGDSGPARRSQGVGLGLAIVRGLTRAQGGEAWYEPGDPTGARFLVRLPGGAS